MKDRMKRTLAIIFGLLIVGVAVFLVLSSERDEFPDWDSFKSEKYGYEVRYPNNYRLATLITESRIWEDDHIREDRRGEDLFEDLVILTDMSVDREMEYLEECVDYYGGCYAVTNLPAGTVAITPIDSGGRDIETQIEEQGEEPDGFMFSDFRRRETVCGEEVRQWRFDWLMQGKKYEMASVSFPEIIVHSPVYYGNDEDLYLDEVMFRMRTEDDREGDLALFNMIVSSFCFTDR